MDINSNPPAMSDWVQALTRNKNGYFAQTAANHSIVIANDPNLQGIYLDEMSGEIEIDPGQPVPWKHFRSHSFGDNDWAGLIVYLSKSYGLGDQGLTKVAARYVAHTRSRHPVRDYLRSMIWDGIPRVDTLLVDYLGAENCSYTRAVTRKTLVAAVARVMEPGIKFDNALILKGDQGIGKSTFVQRLAGDYYGELDLSKTHGKDGAEMLQGRWIVELGELAGLSRADLESVKAFMTRQDDRYRRPYGVAVERHPRQCIMIGTTNQDTFLYDTSGNRRFWPVKCYSAVEKKPWDMTKDIVDQIWAEAFALYLNSEPLLLDEADAKVAANEQKNTLAEDPREGMIELYLNRLLPTDWQVRDLAERRSFLLSEQAGTELRNKVCPAEIWCECFCKEFADLKSRDSRDITRMMARIPGWVKSDELPHNQSITFPIYGRQRYFYRV